MYRIVGECIIAALLARLTKPAGRHVGLIMFLIKRLIILGDTKIILYMVCLKYESYHKTVKYDRPEKDCL